MNPESFEILEDFLTRLDKKRKLKILEIGSVIKEYNPRRLIPDGWEYMGLDIVAGLGVDIVSKDPYHYPIDDESFDVIVSFWTMEHIPNLWKWVEEVYRILKKGGKVLLIAPTTGRVGHTPNDYWRILPDGMLALIEHAGFKHYRIGVRAGEDEWNPCIGEATK